MRHMMVRLGLAGMIVLLSGGFSRAGIVVLSETPVEAFALPDGSVLTNAYAWRRNSDGIMVIHDGGQYFLNFKTIPDDWRTAYGVDESVEKVAAPTPKRFDVFSLYPLLERIQGLPRTTVTYLESEQYGGQADAELISACLLQALLDKNWRSAERLLDLLGTQFPDFEAPDVKALRETCETCSGKKTVSVECTMCRGKGVCPRCGGSGKIAASLANRDPVACSYCGGSGKCPRCGGKGKIVQECPTCEGLGGIMLDDEIRKQLAGYARKLHAVKTGIPVEEPAPEKEQSEDKPKKGDS